MRSRSSSKGGAISTPSLAWIVGGLVSVLAVLAIVLVVMWAFRRARKEGFADSCKFKLIFFTMDGCPHCVAFAPEWKKCKTTLANGDVCLEEVTSDDKQRMKEYKVDGFPTVILENTETGKRTTYAGARNAESLKAFLKQNAQ
jgi:hypothetical protein